MGENCTLFDFDRLDGGFGSRCHSSPLRSLHFSPYLCHTGITINEVQNWATYSLLDIWDIPLKKFIVIHSAFGILLIHNLCFLSSLILSTPRTTEVAFEIFASTDIPVLI